MKWLIVSAIFCLCYGCDDRTDGLKGFNDPPTILIGPQLGSTAKRLTDSIKFSQPQFAYLPFALEISDPNENIKLVSMRVLTGSGYVLHNQDTIYDTVRVTGNKGIYSFVPLQLGKTEVSFVVKDYFNQADSASMQVYVFDNLPPVAAIAANYSGINSQREYLLDGSASFDADHSFGGTIVQYLFSVNNVRIAASTKPVIPYIFAGPGINTIALQVMDNDSRLSKPANIQINVP